VRLSTRRHGALGVLFAVAMASTATNSLAQSAAREDTLVIENISERVTTPENYNPFLPSTLQHAGLQQVGQESLFYYNYETGEMVPWLAEGYEFNDAFDEVTIKLRPAAKWSDGTPFTADDVVYTLETLKANAPQLGNWSVTAKTWVETVEAVDPNTVRIKLTSPNPRYMLDAFGVRIYGTTMILPKHIWENQDPLTFSNFDIARGLPVSTSPYQLISSTSTETVWQLRETWWAAESGFKEMPQPQQVIFRTAGSEERRAAMAGSNELDTLWVLGRDNFEQVVANNPDVASWFKEAPYAYLDPCPRYMSFNTTQAPFDDPQLRWAVSQAIDRDAVVDIAWENLTVPSKWMTPDYPPFKPYMDANADLFEQFNTLEYSVDKSAATMEAAGYTKSGEFWSDKSGNPITVDIVIRQGEADQTRMAPVVTQLLRRAGFDANFQLADIAAFSDALNTGRADAWLDVSCGGISDPYGTLELYHSRHAAPMGQVATGARTRWVNPEYDAIVEKMAVTSADDPAMQELFRQALDIWLKELPAVPLVQAALLTSFNSHYWTNWPDAENNYVHPGFWWATALLTVTEIDKAQQ
jgi:peptide/nickel transport system substrate-binding protein